MLEGARDKRVCVYSQSKKDASIDGLLYSLKNGQMSQKEKQKPHCKPTTTMDSQRRGKWRQASMIKENARGKKRSTFVN